jgi:hypothetical protein
MIRSAAKVTNRIARPRIPTKYHGSHVVGVKAVPGPFSGIPLIERGKIAAEIHSARYDQERCPVELPVCVTFALGDIEESR